MSVSCKLVGEFSGAQTPGMRGQHLQRGDAVSTDVEAQYAYALETHHYGLAFAEGLNTTAVDVLQRDSKGARKAPVVLYCISNSYWIPQRSVS